MKDAIFQQYEAPKSSRLEHPKCDYCGSTSHHGSKCELYASHTDMGSLEAQADAEWRRGRAEVLARRQAVAFGGPWQRFIPKAMRTKDDEQVIADYCAATRVRERAIIQDVLAGMKARRA